MSELSTTEVRQIVEEVCQHLVDTTGNYQRNIINYDDQDIERERIFKKSCENTQNNSNGNIAKQRTAKQMIEAFSA